MSGTGLGPEFSLLARCCRWNFRSAGAASPVQIPPVLDWALLVGLARRHRVQGLAWNALARHADRLPGDAKEALSSDARTIAATNLGIAEECRALQRQFGQSNIPLLFIKGLSVGALAYRSPLLKMGWDIDLLIDPADLDAAAQLLSDRGYAPRLPSTVEHLQPWHGRCKESVWQGRDGFCVELHTRLADNRSLIPTINAHSPQQLVEITPQLSLPTLANDELFAYLAVHGASSAWFRLKWISDFAALLDGRGGKIERFYRRSQQLGADRAAGQALLLADTLFDLLDPLPHLREELASDRSTRLLCRAALRMITDGTREPTERLLGTFAIHWTQLLLAPGFGYKMSELRRQCSLLMLQRQ